MKKNLQNNQREKNTYLRPCRKCENLFKPISKYTKICDDCKIKASEEKKKAKIQQLGKIKTKVSCPKCGETIDFSHIKQAVRDRIDQELDTLLNKL